MWGELYSKFNDKTRERCFRLQFAGSTPLARGTLYVEKRDGVIKAVQPRLRGELQPMQLLLR